MDSSFSKFRASPVDGRRERDEIPQILCHIPRTLSGAVRYEVADYPQCKSTKDKNSHAELRRSISKMGQLRKIYSSC
jgi:hypothetical protein